MPGTRKLNRPTDQRKAMLRNLVTSFLENGRIETTLTRAKETQSMAEKMITLGKTNTLHSRRQALEFITKEDDKKLSFKNGDYIFVPEIRKAVENKDAEIKAYVVGDTLKEVTFTLGDMTDAEREIILKGCLINYYKG